MTNTARASFLIFMLACVAGFLTLGTWQVKRLHWKQGLLAQIEHAYANDPAPPFVKEKDIASLEANHFIRGMFRGHLDFPRSFQLQGQIDNGMQTSHTLVPYIISKDLTILVDFGPDFTTKDKNNGNTVLSGLLRNAPKPNPFTLNNAPERSEWFSININQLGIKNLKPLLLIPEHTPWKDYAVKKPELKNDHLQYASFWFSMAVITLVLTVYFLKKKGTE